MVGPMYLSHSDIGKYVTFHQKFQNYNQVHLFECTSETLGAFIKDIHDNQAEMTGASIKIYTNYTDITGAFVRVSPMRY